MKYWLGMVLSKLRDVSMKLPKLPFAGRTPDRRQLKFAAILSCVLVVTIFSGIILTTFAIDWGFFVTEARVNETAPGLVIVEVDIPSWPTAEIQRVIYPRRVIPFDPYATHTGHVPQFLFIEIAWPNPDFSQVTSRQDHQPGMTRDAVRDFIAASGTFTPPWSGVLPATPSTLPLFSPQGAGADWPAPNAGWIRLETRQNIFLNALGEEVTSATPGAQRYTIEVFGYQNVTHPGDSTPPVYNAVRVANFLEGLHRNAEYARPMGTEFPMHIRAFATQSEFLPNALSGINIPTRGSNLHTAPTNMNSWSAEQRLANAFRIYLGRSLDPVVLPALVAGNVDGF